MKKFSVAAVFGVVLFGAACSREAMELSPEALHSYGTPAQSSNFDASKNDKKEKDTAVSWFDSSAIVSKKTFNY